MHKLAQLIVKEIMGIILIMFVPQMTQVITGLLFIRQVILYSRRLQTILQLVRYITTIHYYRMEVREAL